MSIVGQKIIWTGTGTGPAGSMKTAVFRESVSCNSFKTSRRMVMRVINRFTAFLVVVQILLAVTQATASNGRRVGVNEPL